MDIAENHTTCEILESNSAFIVLAVAIFLLAAIGLLLNLILINAILRSSILPNNVQRLLTNLSVAIIFLCCSFISNSSRKIFLYINGFSSMNELNCYPFEAPSEIGERAILLSLAVICFERWLSTRAVASTSRASINALLLIGAIWMVDLVCEGITFIFQVSALNLVCFCESFYILDEIFFYCSLAPFVIIEISSVAFYFFVLKQSKIKLQMFSINTTKYSLDERFELKQTIELTEMLLPTVLLHAICWLAVHLGAICIELSEKNDRETIFEENLIQAVTFLQALLTIIHPIVLFVKNVRLRKIIMMSLFMRKLCWCHVPSDTSETAVTVAAPIIPHGVDADRNAIILQQLWETANIRQQHRRN